MILWAMSAALTLGVHAADLNDRVRLVLDGGESVEGYFYQSLSDGVVLTRPGASGTTTIPLSIVSAVEVNGKPISIADFSMDLKQDWKAWTEAALNPPAHPHPLWVGISSGMVAGGGHGLLKRWDLGASMIAVDLACMSMVGMELAGRGTGRVDVLFGSVALSLIFKSYAISDGVRRATRIRERMRAASSVSMD